MRLAATLSLTLSALAAACAAPGRDEPSCARGTGLHDGYFYTSWRDSGSVCMTLGQAGRYAVTWDLRPRGNMVVGKGWRTGSATRRVGYRADAFEPGSNGYLTLYGWTTGPLIEYYVVDYWGANFTPPGADAAVLGTVESDGAPTASTAPGGSRDRRSAVHRPLTSTGACARRCARRAPTTRSPSPTMSRRGGHSGSSSGRWTTR